MEEKGWHRGRNEQRRPAFLGICRSFREATGLFKCANLGYGPTLLGFKGRRPQATPGFHFSVYFVTRINL